MSVNMSLPLPTYLPPCAVSFASSQKDQIEQLQSELLNSALQYGEQLDTFATELAAHVNATTETADTQQAQATKTIFGMKQAQQEQMDALRSELAHSLQVSTGTVDNRLLLTSRSFGFRIPSIITSL